MRDRPLGNAAGRRLSLPLLLALACGSVLAAGSGSGVRAQESMERRSPTQRLVLAYYLYSFQGDPRKPVPTQGIRTEKGQSLLTDHPWDSVGPWFSYDRAVWHRSQLQNMTCAGIDVALTVYRGGLKDRRTWAIKGLDALAQALKEMRGEGTQALTRRQEFPRIGLALDLRGLADQYGGPADLRQPDVQRSLYGMLRDFFLHVPEEFRARVHLPAARVPREIGGGASPRGVAYVVSLLHEEGVTGGGPGILGALSRRFGAEFGASLVWVGTPTLQRSLPELDAVADYPAASRPVAFHQAGWIRTASLGPGADGSAGGGRSPIRSRETGSAFVQDLRQVIQEAPDWVLLDSWNDYARGTEIAPSFEHGQQYKDLLRGAVLDFKQSQDYAAQFLHTNAPRVIQSGSVYQVEVVVQNSGTADWDQTNVASLTYRWFQNGTAVGRPGVTIQRTGQKRGESRPYLIGVLGPVLEEKGPAPPGEYELEFTMSRLARGEELFFGGERTEPLRVPVTVGSAPAGRPCWSGSTLSSVAQRGASYPVEVRVRNDGSDTWKPGAVSLGYRWRRVSTYLKGGPAEEDTVLGEGPRVPLAEEVPPGRLATLKANVVAALGEQPLPTWSPRDDWVYILEWDLFQDGRPLRQSGAAVLREPVEVVDRDPAPHFIACSLDNDLVAGRTYPVTVALRNNGPNVWKKGRDRVVVHWYYLDGTEASWTDDSLPLPEDVPPFSRVELEYRENSPFPVPVGAAGEKEGEKGRGRSGKPGKTRRATEVQDLILRQVPVRVPYYFGPMFCVLDFQHDGLPASTSAATRGTDIYVMPVNVFSPTFTPLPIFGQFNTDGISADSDRSDGDLDGFGNTLPAEHLPPYVARPAVGSLLAPTPLYPSGLWITPLNDLDNSRVCFLYPNKAPATPNLVACQGQELSFPGLQRKAVHFLAVATREDVSGEFVFTYSDGSKARHRLSFTYWTDAPKQGEKTAFLAPHRHTQRGDDPTTRCHLNRYTLPAEQLKQLVAIQLPRLPDVKIMAITLESATLRGN